MTARPLITACCVTWNQPRELGELIECFRRQTYEPRELIVLDDAGQYEGHHRAGHAAYRVVSFPRRFQSLGAKRNACAALARPESRYLAVWDTDDIYLPWALAATVDALRRHPWTQPRQILEWWRPPGDTSGTGEPEVVRQYTYAKGSPDHCAYHGAWGFRKNAFWQAGGYPSLIGSEDNPLADALFARHGPSGDSISERFPEPWYIYSRGNAVRHLSTAVQELELGRHPDPWAEAYRQRGQEAIRWQGDIDVTWHFPYDTLTIPPASECRGRPW